MHRRETQALMVALAALAAGVGARGLRRVEVRGVSMWPTLEPGDRLLAVPVTWPWRRTRAGDLVVLADPREPGRRMVKRAAAVSGSRVWVVGDNQTASSDSGTFGPVPSTTIAGRAVYRYFPSGRAGRLSPKWQAHVVRLPPHG